MESKTPGGKSPVEKKSPPIGNNIVWYLLAIGVAILLVVGWRIGILNDETPDCRRSIWWTC